MQRIQSGDEAPDFTATTHDGRTVRLSDYRGKQAVVLYFYPRDGTSVCTRQACSFRDAYEDFLDAGAAVIGVSGDSLERHREFAAQQRLPFVLLSDADGKIREAFGVGNTLLVLPSRITFVIDRKGIVREMFDSLLFAERHIKRALEVVRGLRDES